MFLLICPPVTIFSSREAVRDWIVELTAMREEYRGDTEALECIARAERDAAHLLELVAQFPPTASPPAPNP